MCVCVCVCVRVCACVCMSLSNKSQDKSLDNILYVMPMREVRKLCANYVQTMHELVVPMCTLIGTHSCTRRELCELCVNWS